MRDLISWRQESAATVGIWTVRSARYPQMQAKPHIGPSFPGTAVPAMPLIVISRLSTSFQIKAWYADMYLAITS